MIEDLWTLLLALDNSWDFKYGEAGEVVIVNRFGQEVHASNEEQALRGAIGLSRSSEDY
jgi:hypothetical protein